MRLPALTDAIFKCNVAFSAITLAQPIRYRAKVKKPPFGGFFNFNDFLASFTLL